MKNSECYGNNIWTIPDRLILLVLKNCENSIHSEFMELALEVLRKKDRSNSAKRKIRPNFKHKHNFLSFKTFRAPYKGLVHIIISYGRVTLNYFAIFQSRAVESGMRWAVSTFFENLQVCNILAFSFANTDVWSIIIWLTAYFSLLGLVGAMEMTLFLFEDHIGHWPGRLMPCRWKSQIQCICLESMLALRLYSYYMCWEFTWLV